MHVIPVICLVYLLSHYKVNYEFIYRQCEINIHTFAAPNYYEFNQLRRAILQSLDRIQMYFALHG